MEVPRLGVTPQQCQILSPLSRAGDRTCLLMDTSLVLYHWATVGTPRVAFFSLGITSSPLRLWYPEGVLQTSANSISPELLEMQTRSSAPDLAGQHLHFSTIPRWFLCTGTCGEHSAFLHFYFVLFCFKATPAAYGSSQARGPIGARVTGL